MNRKAAVKITVAIALLSALTAGSFFLWRRHQPLVMTHSQAFLFEPHPRAIDLVASRPIVAATVTGGLYLLSVEKQPGADQSNTLNLRMSHDAGEHWMAPTSLSAPGALVNTSSENAPQLAAHGMYAFALWQEKSAAGATQLKVGRSTGMDSSPASAAVVTDKSPADSTYSGFASMSVAPNGDVYIVWLDGRDDTSKATGTFNVYLARSTDRGVTFRHNVKVAALACPCCRPSVAIAPDGHVYVAYRHVYTDNERDIAVSTSTDKGEHFGDPVRVASDHWKLYGCPESGPVTAIQSGKLVVAWFTAAEDHSGIRLAASVDGGKNFSRELLASPGIQAANHPYLSVSDGGTIAMAFSGRLANNSGFWDDVSSFVVRVDNTGHISQPAKVPSNGGASRYPTISLASDGDIYVAWSTEDSKIALLARGVSR
jgi:BNR repeat-like domain